MHAFTPRSKTLVLTLLMCSAMSAAGQRFVTPPVYTVGDSPIGIAVADFNGDGKPDVVVANNFSNSISVLLNNGSGALLPAGDGTFNFVKYGLGAEYHAVGDFNGDNAPDVALYNGVGVFILQNTGGTTDMLTSSVNPSKLHQSVTFKAAVSATVKGSPGGTPTGTVTFWNGKSKLGKVALRNGQAFFATSNLSAGTHKITAAYSGDGNFNPNVSVVLSQTVHP